MKNINFKARLAVLLFCIVLGSGCDNPCKDVNCTNGTCEEGDCICDEGYEGSYCDLRQVTKYMGTWKVEEDCASGSKVYFTNILPIESDITGMEFDNLAESATISDKVYAEVNGYTFTIPNQTLGSMTIEGSGDMDTGLDTITVSYILTTGAVSTSCTSLLIRQ